MTKKELENYYIKFNSDDECKRIAIRLKNLGYYLLNYKDIVEYGSRGWEHFNFWNVQWVRSNEKGKKEIIYFDEFMKMEIK